jgi:hypothetical protein
MKKIGLKRILSSSLALLFLVVQIFFMLGKEAKADTKKGVEISVVSNDRIIVKGKSSKYNGYEALKDVLDKNNIDIQTKDEQYGKYIESIGNVKAKTFGGYDGWLYAVNRNGNYENITVSIDKFVLKDGDKLIVFYGDMGTLTANKIEYSTNVPNEELKITLNNTYTDFQTKKQVVQPIKNVKAKIDEKEVEVNENVILIKEGLKEGEHTLELMDFDKNRVPKVVNDVITFNIGNSIKKDNTDLKTIDLDKEISDAVSYIKQSENYDLWAEISMMKLNVQPNNKFIESRNEYISKTYEEVKKNGTNNINNIDMEKLIMTLVNAGYSPYDFGGVDLVKELFSRDIDKFLINDVIFGIITLNYCNIEGYEKIEDNYIEYLLNKKIVKSVENKELVGWSYSGSDIDSDITAMAVSALSKYYEKDNNIREVLDKAVDTLSYFQDEKGYVPSMYGISSETVSASIIGLTSLGVSPEESKFLKNKGNLSQALISFKNDISGFKHSLEDNEPNYISSEQALRALISLREFKKNGKYNYYSGKNGEDLKKYTALSENKTNNLIYLGIIVIIGIAGIIIYKRKQPK